MTEPSELFPQEPLSDPPRGDVVAPPPPIRAVVKLWPVTVLAGFTLVLSLASAWQAWQAQGQASRVAQRVTEADEVRCQAQAARLNHVPETETERALEKIARRSVDEACGQRP